MPTTDRPPAALPDLPEQPSGVPWPSGDWPRAAAGRRTGELEEAVHDLFDPEREKELGRQHALVVVQEGRLLTERYGPESGPEVRHISWSMAKSVLHAAVGVAVDRGLLDPAAPAPVPEWSAPGDPRRSITLEHLLRMSSGLRFVEDYVDAGSSDVIEMLFGRGRDDVAAFAAAMPLEHPPGTVWSYSSGTSNVIARILGSAVGGPEACRRFLSEELFGPVGMRSVEPRFDTAGTFIGSSFIFATARDYARFGLLYLRGGRFDRRQILPRGWVDHARTPTPGSGGFYGAHFWLQPDGLGTFCACGFRGQRIVLVPALDLVLVRLGDTPSEQSPALLSALSRVVRACGAPAGWPGLVSYDDLASRSVRD